MTLTEAQTKNLQVFLARVQLTGGEVGAFNEVVQALFSQPLPTEEVKEEEKKEEKKK